MRASVAFNHMIPRGTITSGTDGMASRAGLGLRKLCRVDTDAGASGQMVLCPDSTSIASRTVNWLQFPELYDLPTVSPAFLCGSQVRVADSLSFSPFLSFLRPSSTHTALLPSGRGSGLGLCWTRMRGVGPGPTPAVKQVKRPPRPTKSLSAFQNPDPPTNSNNRSPSLRHHATGASVIYQPCPRCTNVDLQSSWGKSYHFV